MSRPYIGGLGEPADTILVGLIGGSLLLGGATTYAFCHKAVNLIIKKGNPSILEPIKIVARGVQIASLPPMVIGGVLSVAAAVSGCKFMYSHFNQSAQEPGDN